MCGPWGATGAAIVTNNSIILGLPSKGRLKEQCAAWLKAQGYELRQHANDRSYQVSLRGLTGIEVRLLSASDIANGLLSGDLHAGVTGEDLMRERAAVFDEQVALLQPLGFGRADLVVAVPDGWLDVDTVEDLSEVAAEFRARLGRRLRLATKYTNLASRFLTERQVTNIQLVDSAGATEGAPATGMADAIIDITTTGATLRANGLKLLDDGLILASQACLFRSKQCRLSRAQSDRMELLWSQPSG